MRAALSLASTSPTLKRVSASSWSCRAHGPPSETLRSRQRRRCRAACAGSDSPRLKRESLRWFERYFDSRFPFPKYDLVLVPEFAYGGMEHAGATFLREDAVLFPSTPNETDILARAQLLFHETSHQWFGDSV